jgi:hypothetical protein
MDMKYFILAVLVFNFSLAQEEGEKVSRRIKLVENYTVSDFKVPEKIMFYSGGNPELSSNYRALFNKIEERLFKSNKSFKYVFNGNAELPKKLESFDDLDMKFNNDTFDAICVLLLGEVEISEPWSKHTLISSSSGQINGTAEHYVNYQPEYYYDFYLLLVEANTHKILMKRKYSVIGLDLFKTDNYELSKVISKEFKN